MLWKKNHHDRNSQIYELKQITKLQFKTRNAVTVTGERHVTVKVKKKKTDYALVCKEVWKLLTNFCIQYSCQVM